MPDFERLTDKLALRVTERDPEAHAFVRGRIAGKRIARVQIAFVVLAIAIVYLGWQSAT